MIKTNYGVTEAKGNKPTLMSDLTTVIKALRKNSVLTEDDIAECVKVAEMSETELKTILWSRLTF